MNTSTSGGVTNLSIGSPATMLHYSGSVDAVGVIAATETVSGGILTMFNGGGTAVATFNVGTSLNSSNFTLMSEGSGGTDAIVSTVFGTYTGWGHTADQPNDHRERRQGQ